MGYVVFEFMRFDRVIVECPIEDNATYILWGNWRVMVAHRKAEIRSEYRGQYSRVNHTEGWLDRVERAVRGYQW